MELAFKTGMVRKYCEIVFTNKHSFSLHLPDGTQAVSLQHIRPEYKPQVIYFQKKKDV